MSNISDLKSFDDVADYLEITTGYLRKLLFIELKGQYTKFSIPKKRGGTREIHKPSRKLMPIQNKIKDLLEKNFKSHHKAHGFIKERDFISNASNHINRKYVLNIDLEDFFNSISFRRVRQMFIGYFKLNKEVSTVLANLCCHPSGFLPQGAPTSPIISNILLKTLDKEMTDLAKKCGKTYYTRYADDITVSSNNSEFPTDIAFVEPNGTVRLSDTLLQAISRNGFNINYKKVRMQAKNQNQTVTGITVNKKINIDRRYVKNIRAILYNFDVALVVEKEIEKFCVANSQDNFKTVGSIFNCLKGRILHIAHVRGYSDSVFQKLAKHFNGIVDSRRISVNKISEDSSKTFFNDNVFIISPGDDFCRYIIDDSRFDETLHDQGTAFYLKGIGIVTNYHVVKDLVNDVIEKGYSFCKKYYVKYFSNSEKLCGYAKISYYDKSKDIAILEPENTSFHSEGFEASHIIRENTKIKLIGYPEYRSGDHLRVEEGTILRKVNYENNVRYEISSLIFGGNSGGPILNKSNKVIGVAVKGVTSKGAVPPQIIPIQQVINLIEEQRNGSLVMV